MCLNLSAQNFVLANCSLSLVVLLSALSLYSWFGKYFSYNLFLTIVFHFSSIKVCFYFQKSQHLFFNWSVSCKSPKLFLDFLSLKLFVLIVFGTTVSPSLLYVFFLLPQCSEQRWQPEIVLKILLLFLCNHIFEAYKYAIQLAINAFIPKSFLYFQLFHTDENL